MRLAIELDGVRHEVETSQYAETATLADLVEAVCGTSVAGEETLWVDDHEHTGNARLSDLLLFFSPRARGSRARGLRTPQPLRGWAALMSGGLDAGRTIPAPTTRPMLIGRSPQADLTVDSPSASWSHARVEVATEVEGKDEVEETESRNSRADAQPQPGKRKVEGLRVTDDGSTNGTFVDGVKVPDEGVFITDDEAVLVVGGTSVTLRRQLAETLAPSNT